MKNEENIVAGSNTNCLHPVIICKKDNSPVVEATDTLAIFFHLPQ